ncbi:MAG TPA: LacI family DNA-binding transcriptional regulator, partial [Acidimicrobiales bacterium]|nr:LacI family DNA-binding transcriptional regulator [Acidimicrobiales bacterium]
RVLNGEPSVRPGTAGRVMEAVRRLGFQKNEAAAALRRGTRVEAPVVGLVVADPTDAAAWRLARGAGEAGWERGACLLVTSSQDNAGVEADVVRLLVGRGIDGLLLVPTEADHSFLDAVLDDGPPLVFLGRPASGFEADTVVAADADAARRAVDLLLDRGHRRIAFVAAVDHGRTVRERRRGYTCALAERGVPFDAALVHVGGPATTLDEGLAAVLAAPRPPTAILCADHDSTVAVLRAVRVVPADPPAVACFDDVELADLLDPSMTVVAPAATALGRTAAELLFRRIDGDRRPAQHVSLQPVLIPGGHVPLRPDPLP